ncbi:sigma-70 family RNA polymerase sigma factor [Flammeovirga yaeyamensis]|uniref:Sigma-70 family RNA polymerase sigma factor n=1 Tax=Flammeovirga yaeyamensis TaxID=367791 RepID=A0AAX1MZ72_9BACT|nr:sigma-70 family RNA polymerase sigma factor [Flammeovirga yaeyamensis]MBB3695910.1 RNA polymerase sigma-70 factor (ECF subfamily) [Flammeovirga yaeyamensis]NMF34599.1 sigma-70 family RNA polymerase sigma factor [Flammeovirga yaeyamensis]QWG00571.1 sigma-70 family RNA polymerase sigma factor [Flammeovirga yaeyamensis]
MISDWVNTYADDLYRWVLKRTNDVQLSEDLVQETFIAAHQSFDKFEGKSSPKTWLTAILKYKLMDHFRKQEKKKEKVTSDFFFNEKGHWKEGNNPYFWGDTDEHLLDNSDFQKVLAGCLSNLPDRSRIAITSKFLDEKKAEEICHDLEITTSNYWQLIHRAKLSLRNCLQLNWFKN